MVIVKKKLDAKCIVITFGRDAVNKMDYPNSEFHYRREDYQNLG